MSAPVAEPGARAQASDGTRRFALPGWWPWAGLALLLAVTIGTLMYQGRGGGFYYDDWNFVLQRGDWASSTLLSPHNEHLSVVPIVVYKLLFVTVGLDAYQWYRLVLVLVHASTLTGIFLYARPRVGPALALLIPATVAIFGAAYIDLLWAFQLGYAASLLTGVLAFLALDRGTRRGDVVACVMVCVSLGSSSVGLCVLAAVAVEVAGTALRRRWWIVAIPVVLYAGWYLKYQLATSPITLNNVLAAPQYTGQGFAATVGALAGLTIDWGRPIGLALLVALLWRGSRYPNVPWRLLALLAVPLAFWVLAAFARANQVGAETARYLYPPAVFLLMAAVEGLAGLRIQRRMVAVFSVVVVAGAMTNLAGLRAGGQDLGFMAAKLYGALGAIEVAGPRLDKDYVPASALSPQVSVGPYLAAIKRFGPIVGGEAGVEDLAEAGRQFADNTLQNGFAVTPQPAQLPTQGAPPAVESTQQVTAQPQGPCVQLTPTGSPAAAAFPLPDSGLVIKGPVDTQLQLRMWGAAFVNSALTPKTSKPVLLQVPEDGARATWHAQVVITGPTKVCGTS